MCTQTHTDESNELVRNDSLVLASYDWFPSTIVYDDGCHLAEYLRHHYGVNSVETSPSTTLKNTCLVLIEFTLKTM